MFTDLAYSDGYDVLYPSSCLAKFNQEVISRRGELPRMWKEFIISLRRYYAYLSQSRAYGPKLIEELYTDLFDSSEGKKLYEDYRVKRLKANKDPDRLFELYYEYFPNPDETDFSDIVEEVLRTHYTASLAAYSIIRRKEHLSGRLIHAFVIKVLKQSYTEFWVQPEDDGCSGYFFTERYDVSRKQEPTLPWQEEFFEFEDFSNDRPYGSDPHPEDWR